MKPAEEQLAAWLVWSGGQYPDDSPGDVIAWESDGTITLDDGITTWNPLRALAAAEAELAKRGRIRPRPAFGRNEALYFGCRNQAGHFFVNAWGDSPGYDEMQALLPFEKIDGGLVPRGSTRGEQGLARLIRRDGWTCIAFCDRSVDTRGGSNAAFFFKALLSFDEILIAARETFPWKTFPFQIVLDEETSDPAVPPETP